MRRSTGLGLVLVVLLVGTAGCGGSGGGPPDPDDLPGTVTSFDPPVIRSGLTTPFVVTGTDLGTPGETVTVAFVCDDDTPFDGGTESTHSFTGTCESATRVTGHTGPLDYVPPCTAQVGVGADTTARALSEADLVSFEDVPVLLETDTDLGDTYVYLGCGDGRLHALLNTNQANQPDAALYYTHSLDGGATWNEQRVTVVDDPVRVIEFLCRDELLLVFYNPGLGETGTCWLTRSEDNGASWSSPVRVDSSPDASKILGLWLRPVAWSGNDVVFAWLEQRRPGLTWTYDVFARRSSDNGATWEPGDVRLNTYPDADLGGVSSHSLHVAGGTIWFTCYGQEPDRRMVILNRSTDGGASWWPEAKILFEADSPVGWPRIAGGASALCVTWDMYDLAGPSENEPTAYRIHALRSTDGGATWPATPSTIAGPTDTTLEVRTFTRQPSGPFHLVYLQRPEEGSSQLVHARATDDGVSWTLTTPPLASFPPEEIAARDLVVSASDAMFTVLWQGGVSTHPTSPGGPIHLHANYTLDRGATWLPSPVVVDQNHDAAFYGMGRGLSACSRGRTTYVGFTKAYVPEGGFSGVVRGFTNRIAR